MAAVGSLAALAALHLAIGLAWWRWLRGAPSPARERLLCTALLSLAQVVGISLLLGWLGWLAPLPLIGAVLTASAGVARSAGSPAPVPSRAAAPARRAERYGILVLASMLAAGLGLAAARGVLAPDPGWDGLKYHLPMTALMRQTQSLDLGPVHNLVIAAYPKSGEIWAHWLLAVSGDDRWLSLQQMPFLAVALLATYCAARRLGSRAAAAGVATLLLAFAPVVLMQVTTAYTDVLLSAMVLSGVALLLAARAALSLPLALALGAALGLLIGTKFSGVTLAAVLFAALVAAVWRRQPGARRRLVVVAVLAGGLGADAYARNLIRYGNPVFPFRANVLGWALPGPRDGESVYGIAQTAHQSAPLRLWRSWSAIGATSHSGIYGGFGLVWPFLAVALIASTLAAARRRERRRLLIYGLLALLFLLTPVHFRVRFVLFLLGAGSVALADLLDRAGPAWRAVLIGASVVVALTGAGQAAAAHWRALAGAATWPGDLCQSAPPAAYRQAYAWLRRHAGGRDVLRFRGPELFPYCLWTPAVDNRVFFVEADDPAGLPALAAGYRRPILVLQPGTPEFEGYLATAGHWTVAYADPRLTVVAPASPP